MSPGRLGALALTLGALAAPGRGSTAGQEELMARMRGAGLERVELLTGASPPARGYLPGGGELAVLLFAGCGPGAEASREAALAAAADLTRTPRRHTLELVLCAEPGPGSRPARRAAQEWLDLHPAEDERDDVLAALHLELGDRGAGTGVGRLLAAGGPGGRRLPPAWLAHAVLSGARAGGGRLGIGDRRWPLMGQLLGRHGRLRATSGAEPFLGAGVPALTLAGSGKADGAAAGWPAVLAAVVRRLDSLAGRPRDDDVYLALGGRVWARRNLYWCGLAVWVALVAAGLPGAWRGAGSRQRRRRGRRYLPGFVFRMLFLGTLLMAPVATLVLLGPAALLTLAPLRRRAAINVARGLAAAPTLTFAGYSAAALAAGRVAAWPAQPLRLVLVLCGVTLAVSLIGRPSGGGSVTATD